MGTTLKELCTDAKTKPQRSRKIFTNAMQTTGNQSVAGVKTFASSPVVPTPTTNMQAATKKYVDDQDAALLATVQGVDATQPKTVKVTVDNATLLALQTAGDFDLIAAPAAGKQLVVHKIVLNYKRGAASFTNAGGGALTITLGAVAVHNLADLAALIIAGASAVTQLEMKDNIAIAAATALKLHKATANFAAGDGSADFWITYSTITL